MGRALLIGLSVTAVAFAVAVAVIVLVVGPIPVARPWGDVVVLLPLTIAVVVVTAAAWPIADDRAQRWLARRGLPDEPELRAAAARWLRRTRTARGFGAVAALLLGSAPAYLVNVSTLSPGDPQRVELLDLVASPPLGLPAIIGGYALGALVAELRRRPVATTAEPPTTRVAALTTREPRSYLVTLSRFGPRVLAVVAVVVGIATWLTDAGAWSWGPAEGTVIAAAVGAWLVDELTRRVVLTRRQRATDPLGLAFDDAARATTLHAIAGSAIGVIGWVLGEHLWAVAGMSSGGGRTLLTIAGLLVGVGSVGVWLGHGVGLGRVVSRGRPPGADAHERTPVPS